jgi:hypothetical protein
MPNEPSPLPIGCIDPWFESLLPPPPPPSFVGWFMKPDPEFDPEHATQEAAIAESHSP